jgi:hypothetical protein
MIRLVIEIHHKEFDGTLPSEALAWSGLSFWGKAERPLTLEKYGHGKPCGWVSSIPRCEG